MIRNRIAHHYRNEVPAPCWSPPPQEPDRMPTVAAAAIGFACGIVLMWLLGFGR